MSLIRDLLAGPGNHHWDLGRIASAWGFVGFTASVIWNAAMGQPIDLVQIGTGYGLLLGGSGALIALKDRSHSAPQGDAT